MAEMITPNAIQLILANPTPDSSSPNFPQIVVQVIDLKPLGSKFSFMANDGKMKVKALLQSGLSSEVMSGNIQNLGLIRILDYTLNEIQSKKEKFLIVANCESVSPALDSEYKTGPNGEEEMVMETKKEMNVESQANGIVLKPKQEIVSKSASQIVNEQQRNMAPAARMAMTRRVLPLVSLNPYQGNWTIKVRVTSKGNMRNYTNARGEGCVFNVELTDEDGTQIQATMFNAAAKKFYEKFEMGKVYYISKGSLKVANKQYKTVQNEYEMTLNEGSEVEEAVNEEAFIPETKFNFVPIDELGPYVNGRELVDVIGVVQNVSPTVSIKRKSNSEFISKRDITIADSTKKTVIVSLWNDLATDVGQELHDIADKSPVVAIKSVKVGEFQGVSLSALSKSVIVVNPETPEAKKLKSWFDSEGKDTAMSAVGEGLSSFTPSGGHSMYSDRVPLSHITSNPSLGDSSLGDKKPVYFSIKAYISHIKPDQAMWYRACKNCNKKVTEDFEGGYRCEGCQKTVDDCNMRYIMFVKVSDASGEALLSVFNDQAEKIIGCSADELNDLKSQGDPYEVKLKESTWGPHLFRVGVTTNEYNGEKRQRITIRSIAPIDYAAESKFLLEEISKKMQVSK